MSAKIPKVALLTPTYQRNHFLWQTLRYVKQQNMPNAQLRWFIFDDSTVISSHQPLFDSDVQIQYTWQAQKMTLGAKRNVLNDQAQRWGADFICSMDDDDWYGAGYVSEMVSLLQ